MQVQRSDPHPDSPGRCDQGTAGLIQERPLSLRRRLARLVRRPGSARRVLICLLSVVGLAGALGLLLQPMMRHDAMVRFDRASGAFSLDRSPVTVAQFRSFAETTGWRVETDRQGGGLVIALPLGRWSIDEAASWRAPWGSLRPGHTARDDDPVTQVSWNDADAYCRWAGKRLPSVDEWMHAAKAGNPEGARYAVGASITADGRYLAKVWSGDFPMYNDGAAGEVGAAPIGATGLTPTGLTDMAGNVWNWMSDDRFDPALGAEAVQKALKGGSFLCDENVCRGYDIAARQSSTPDTSAVHIGFRCAR